jgi:GTP pyrophosphokinase
MHVRESQMPEARRKHFPVFAADPGQVQAWLEGLAGGRPAPDEALIRDAYAMACSTCASTEARPQDYCVERALAAADILAGLRLDAESLAAGLLCGLVCRGRLPVGLVQERLGQVVARLVDGVRRMELIDALQQRGTGSGGQVENLRKMLLAMVEDVRVVVIALAERVCVMRTLGWEDEATQRRVAQATMDIYGPLANRLGIGQLKWELEDLSFRYLEPARYKQIAGLLDERREDREGFVGRVVGELGAALEEAGVAAQVHGRAKHIYSIWRKMKRKGVDYHEIYDVRALRVLVDNVRDAYAALGIVHSRWTPVPGEFDDYIATPKENGYRSLHTAVIGPAGKTLEVQIRTHAMHQESELGVAAHWRYKEGARYDASFESKIAWLRQILDWKDEVADAGELLDDFKAEVFEDRVYVFTPNGSIVDLPRGATPLDFAYQIHTEVGHRCRGAKVDGRIVPLTYELKTGEQVQVLTAKNGTPSRDWLSLDLGYLKSTRARHKVRHWFMDQDRDRNLADGRALLDKELQRLGLSNLGLEELAKKLSYPKVEDLLVALGRGDLKLGQVARVAQDLVEPPASRAPVPFVQRAPAAVGLPADIQVEGVGNLLTQMARCCKPVPGDKIIGFITQGRGVTIHRRDCSNILRCREDCQRRLIEVQWGGSPHGVYPVDVRIEAVDRQGLLRDITAVLANEKINVLALNTRSHTSIHRADMSLTLEIGDMAQLSRVLAKINALPNVLQVHRHGG